MQHVLRQSVYFAKMEIIQKYALCHFISSSLPKAVFAKKIKVKHRGYQVIKINSAETVARNETWTPQILPVLK